MNGIERRIERLEKELGVIGERLLVILQLFEAGELQQMRYGETLIDRQPEETEAAFTQRAQEEAMRLSNPHSPCVVLKETRRGVAS